MVLVNTYGVGRPTRRLVGMKRKTGFSHEVGVLLHTAATVASGGSCARYVASMISECATQCQIVIVSPPRKGHSCMNIETLFWCAFGSEFEPETPYCCAYMQVFYKNNPVEAIALCLYFAVNVVAQAYILG
eukprot:scaffold27451_cov18-Tisochrysis_lutea.AAC.1